MSAPNPLPKINQFNFPECPPVSTSPECDWDETYLPCLRWLERYPCKEVWSTWWPEADMKHCSNLLTETLWRLPCEYPCVPISGGFGWIHQRSRRQKSVGSGAGSCSAPSHCTPRARSSSWRQHHEQNHTLLPKLFPDAVNVKQNQILYNEESWGFFASSCRFQFVNSTQTSGLKYFTTMMWQSVSTASSTFMNTSKI